MVGSNNRSDGPRCVTGGGDPGGRLLHSLLPSLWPLRGKVDDLPQEEPECEVLGTHQRLSGYNLHDFVSGNFEAPSKSRVFWFDVVLEQQLVQCQ